MMVLVPAGLYDELHLIFDSNVTESCGFHDVVSNCLYFSFESLFFQIIFVSTKQSIPTSLFVQLKNCSRVVNTSPPRSNPLAFCSIIFVIPSLLVSHWSPKGRFPLAAIKSIRVCCSVLEVDIIILVLTSEALPVNPQILKLSWVLVEFKYLITFILRSL